MRGQNSIQVFREYGDGSIVATNGVDALALCPHCEANNPLAALDAFGATSAALSIALAPAALLKQIKSQAAALINELGPKVRDFRLRALIPGALNGLAQIRNAPNLNALSRAARRATQAKMLRGRPEIPIRTKAKLGDLFAKIDQALQPAPAPKPQPLPAPDPSRRSPGVLPPPPKKVDLPITLGPIQTLNQVTIKNGVKMRKEIRRRGVFRDNKLVRWEIVSTKFFLIPAPAPKPKPIPAPAPRQIAPVPTPGPITRPAPTPKPVPDIKQTTLHRGPDGIVRAPDGSVIPGAPRIALPDSEIKRLFNTTADQLGPILQLGDQAKTEAIEPPQKTNLMPLALLAAAAYILTRK